MISPQHDPVTITACSTIADFFYVRALRNRNRLSLTNDTNLISVYQQLQFILSRPEDIALFVARVRGERAGYLLLRRSDDLSAFITEVVDESRRGMGVGSAMVRFAKSLHTRLIADIRKSNLASIALHEHMGFKLQSVQGEILTYTFTQDVGLNDRSRHDQEISDTATIPGAA